MINIQPRHLEIVRKILRKHVPEYDVRAFGSRITGTIKKYSDLDLVIVGKEKLLDNILFSLKEDFQESDLPFRVEILDWNAASKEFQKIIEKKYEIIHKPFNKRNQG